MNSAADILDDLFGGGASADDADDGTLPRLPLGTYARVADPVPLGAILVDPAHNVSRGGTLDPPTHPDVVKIIQSLRASGSTLCHGLGLRPLAVPIARPCGRGPCCAGIPKGETRLDAPFHLFELWYGFRRYASLVATGRTHLHPARNEIKYLVDDDGTPWSIDRCGDANLIENTARGDPSEFQISMAVAQLAREGQPVEVLAARLSEHPDDTRVRLRILERCPLAVRAAWARNPRRAGVLRALARISGLDPYDKWPLEKRHAAMLEMWTAYEAESDEARTARAERRAQEAEAQVRHLHPGAPAPEWVGRRKPRTPAAARPATRRAIGAAVTALRGAVDTATEVCDPASGWRPLTAGERAFAQALLAALARGDGGAVLR